MRVAITGADGYIGRKLVTTLEEKGEVDKILEIDAGYRRKWVREICETPLYEPPMRDTCIKVDIARGGIVPILKEFKPDVIVHLAAQPSAPYSESNLRRAIFTQTNNIIGTLKILWYVKGQKEKPKIVYTSTTGIYGTGIRSYIGEGFDPATDIFHPNLANSVYHISKGFDVENAYMFYRKGWIDDFIDLRTSIVFGVDPDTRFDVDTYFGTFYNRMLYFAVVGRPLTIYGSGKQWKPFISLDNCVESIINAMFLDTKGFQVFNQLTYQEQIKKVAKIIAEKVEKITGKQPNIVHIPNPRVEPEKSNYEFANRRFLKLVDEVEGLEQRIEKDVRTLVDLMGGTV